MSYVKLSWRESQDEALGVALEIASKCCRPGMDPEYFAENLTEALEADGRLINYDAAYQAYEIAEETKRLLDPYSRGNGTVT